MDWCLSGRTTPGQSGPGSDYKKGVFHITQSSSITQISRFECLVSYLGQSLVESYLSAEMQSMYFAAPSD